MTATTRLQGIGIVKAREAQQLNVGDTVAWNYGSTSVVSDIQTCGKKMLTITFLASDGKHYTRRFSKTRKFAY